MELALKVSLLCSILNKSTTMDKFGERGLMKVRGCSSIFVNDRIPCGEASGCLVL